MSFKTVFNACFDYIKSYPKHFACYFGLGGGVFLTSFYVRKSKYEPLRMAYAGAIAQLGMELFFHPIDLINTKIKAEIISKVNTIEMIRRIRHKEGFLGFFHGLSATYYGAFIGGIVYFGTYKLLKSKLVKETSIENTKDNFIAYNISSIISEFLYMIIYYPMELIQTRMQTRTVHVYNDVIDGFVKIFGKKGIIRGFKNLYIGATPSFILNITNSSLIFSITESMRERFKLKKNISHVKDLSSKDYHTCSIVAGVFSGAITNIMEVITIKKQLDGKKFHLLNFLKEHGFYSLRAGILARVTTNTLQTVALFLIIDEIGVFFNVEL